MTPGHIILAGLLIFTAGLGVFVCTPAEARALEWAGKVGRVVIILGLIVTGLGIAWGLG